MMKRTDAGWVSFVSRLIIIGATVGGGEITWAQEPATVDIAEEIAPAVLQEYTQLEMPVMAETAATSPASSTPGPEYTYQKKLAELRTADVEVLRQALAEVEAGLDGEDVDIGATSAQVKAAREQAEANSEEVKKLRMQITRLYEEIRLAVDRDPAVVGAKAAADKTHMQLMDRLNFRTGLMQLIADKERQSKWTVSVPTVQENNQ